MILYSLYSASVVVLLTDRQLWLSSVNIHLGYSLIIFSLHLIETALEFQKQILQLAFQAEMVRKVYRKVQLVLHFW